MIIRINLDTETQKRLIRMAIREQRPVAFQAEVLLKRALELHEKELEAPAKQGSIEKVLCA